MVPVLHAVANSWGVQVTYPLDTLRLRMAVDPTTRSVVGAAGVLLREGSYQAFFRGLGASLVGEWPLLSVLLSKLPFECHTLLTWLSVIPGIAPYMAMELCIFDIMPKDLPPFVRGFSAALISTSVCYPLDTIR